VITICLLAKLLELLVQVLEALATEAESLELEVFWRKTMVQVRRSKQDVPPFITVHEQQVSTVEEFVYLGAVIHSTTQSTPDITVHLPTQK